jgi:hypothetical protein
MEEVMNARNINELIDQLTAAAGDAEPLDWRAAAGPKDVAHELSVATAAPAAAPASKLVGRCACCDVELPLSETGFCRDCAELYQLVSARTIATGCHCGHEPASPQVYLHRQGGKLTVLCSLSCVQHHFRQIYRFYFRQ